MIILDTNVLSEIVKPLPSPVVMRWFASLPAKQIYTTSITAAGYPPSLVKKSESMPELKWHEGTAAPRGVGAGRAVLAVVRLAALAEVAPSALVIRTDRRGEPVDA